MTDSRHVNSEGFDENMPPTSNKEWAKIIIRVEDKTSHQYWVHTFHKIIEIVNFS